MIIEQIIDNNEEFLKFVEIFKENENVVFRGQNNIYKDINNECIFMPSIFRTPCNPEQNFKWWFYCRDFFKEIKENKFDKLENEIVVSYIESLLQHYGWRSQKLDLTKDLAVALFFACFQYKSHKECQLIEDCYEKGIIDSVDFANYIESNEEYGYIFVFDKKMLINNLKRKYIDLTELFYPSANRPDSQKAIVVNISDKNDFNFAELKNVYKIKTKIILEFCVGNDIDLKALFPSDSKDILYRYLTTLPRKIMDKELGFFTIKELGLPIYSNCEYEKIKTPDIAFYKNIWLVKKIFNKNNDLKCLLVNGQYLKMKDLIYCYIYYDSNRKIINVMNYLKTLLFSTIIIEFNGLIRKVIMQKGYYIKGIIIEKISEQRIKVSPIVVEWYGTKISNAGIFVFCEFQVEEDLSFKFIANEEIKDNEAAELWDYCLITADFYLSERSRKRKLRE